MATPALPSSLFTCLVNIWRLLALRSDIDSIILELLGHFSLEKVYSDGDKETYQRLVITLLAQLNSIFYIQRLSLPSGSLQVSWYLGLLTSWEVTVRAVEFVLQIFAEGRESLWEVPPLRDKYVPEFLLSAFRVLMLHPKAPRTKDCRDRFGRIHRSLELIYDGYPGSKSFLLLVCKEVTDSLRNNPNALALPRRLRAELPNLASEQLYPLADCLSPQYVSTIVTQESSPPDWLPQFLTLRDISQFIVGASIQHTVNLGTCGEVLQSHSAKTQNAILQALENMRMPAQFSRLDLIAAFCEIFSIILPDALNVLRQGMSEPRIDECQIDALDAFCVRLNDRLLVHRVSDREMMNNISEIARKIALLDDPTGQFRSQQPRLYAANCKGCHIIGYSQLKHLQELKFPLDAGDTSEISLPSKLKCIHCGEIITKMREILLARHTWELLKPLQSNADTINVERHLPTQFQLSPPKAEMTYDGYSSLSVDGQRSHKPRYSFPNLDRSIYAPSNSLERSRYIPQAAVSPRSPGFPQRLDGTHSESSPLDIITSFDEGLCRSPTEAVESPSLVETPYSGLSPLSPDFIITQENQPRMENYNSITSLEPVPSPKTQSIPLAIPPEKGRFGWRSKLIGAKRDSRGNSGDSSSLSSTNLDSQRIEEISLKSLINATKNSGRGKSGKNISVYLSQNSTYALFWTQPSIHIWDVGTSPPSFRRAISTESTCVLATVAKAHLAYIIGTRDQKLTLRIMNIIQPSAQVVEYRMPSSPWCRSIAVCPREKFIVVGFENSTVRFFNTAHSEQPREDRLHSRYHRECKECPSVETLSFSNDGLVLLASTRSPRTGMIQIYSWRFPFLTFQELSSCRYHVPLHESEDNGVSSAISTSMPGSEENLICITTWTQSGVPILAQPGAEGHRSKIKNENVFGRHGRLGSRIQCAAFSPSGSELAMVNDKGHLYQISRLNSNPMDIKMIATSKELTTKSNLFAMAFMTLLDEEAIVLIWADSGKSTGFVKKIPIRSTGDIGISATNSVVYVPPPNELSGNGKEPAMSLSELAVTEAVNY